MHSDIQYIVVISVNKSFINVIKQVAEYNSLLSR